MNQINRVMWGRVERPSLQAWGDAYELTCRDDEERSYICWLEIGLGQVVQDLV